MAVLLLVAMVVFFLLLGKLTPGSGADVIDWDPVGRAEAKAGMDQEDLDEMLELNNRYRRDLGLPELRSVEELYGE